MINRVEKVCLGGVDQWYVARGSNEQLPLLLFLHGGPGSPQTGAQHKFNRELEDHFLVINWDQRGAGKSYYPSILAETMSVGQLLLDAIELIQHLCDRFNQKKLFIMGHSMGAVLGVLLIKQIPSLVHAYVGINQPINRIEEEERSFAFTLDEAYRRNNRKAIKDLSAVGKPERGMYPRVQDLVTQRKWLTTFQGVTYKKNAMWINLHYILSSHLSWKERFQFMKGFSFSTETLWGELNSINLSETALKLEVDCPIYFIMGRYDRISHDTVEEYFKHMDIPKKELIIFENSGHYACFEEPEKFNKLMIQTVRSAI
ncbi:alpha/beta fold hydrolase [Bacillus horti]|uniref:Pimeloyl-ACP methyl ester carboxylesterase n=1 Tax=Caldalkalibacillus horti TaxID=77523 RepID=A0ABT9W5S0_9BACI|nr:alpha/beta hydrolase [Bacillus horti]MDQ0168422.1 pimeloyl-ACP methyl ester carboxylesterase [Bacillus horti]